MIKLIDLLNEDIQKSLLNECFIDQTFLDMFDENPNIFNILKNNILNDDGHIIKYKNKESLANDLSHWGGALDFDGIINWNKPDVIDFFEKVDLSPKGLILIKKELEKVHNVFTKKYMHDMIKKVGIEMKSYGEPDWTSSAMCDLPKNKKLSK